MSRPLISLTLTLLLAAPALAQDAEVQIETTKIRGGVHMLQGQGGNMGLFVGEDGAFLIDDQFAPLTKKIQAAIAEVTPKEVRFLVNTHWHGDHTGGNENLGKAGAVIVAHDNVRKRMSAGQFMEAFKRQVPPAPKIALPVITFAQGVTFHWNGDAVKVTHVGPAHTDGDSVVRFTKANVLHTGDTFFNGIYPFIDAGSGGSLAGMINTGRHLIASCDADTKIIPGHGPLATREDFQAFVDMLSAVHVKLRRLRAAGKTADEVVAAKPTEEFDAKWGKGFLPPDTWVRLVYETVTAEPEGR